MNNINNIPIRGRNHNLDTLTNMYRSTNARIVEMMDIFSNQNQILSQSLALLESLNTRLLYITIPENPSRRTRLRRLINPQTTNLETDQETDSLFSPRPIIPSHTDINNATDTIVYSNESYDQSICPIDCVAFNEGELVLKIIGCGHIFRENGLRTWFERDHRCPLCRFSIVPTFRHQNPNPPQTQLSHPPHPPYPQPPQTQPPQPPQQTQHSHANNESIDQQRLRHIVDNFVRNSVDTHNVPSPIIVNETDMSGNLQYRY